VENRNPERRLDERPGDASVFGGVALSQLSLKPVFDLLLNQQQRHDLDQYS
jgi:hypothetical protein